MVLNHSVDPFADKPQREWFFRLITPLLASATSPGAVAPRSDLLQLILSILALLAVLLLGIAPEEGVVLMDFVPASAWRTPQYHPRAGTGIDASVELGRAPTKQRKIG